MSLPGLTSLEGKVVGSWHSTKEFNVGKTNLVGNKRRSPLNFKSNWIEHVYGNKHKLGNSDWVGKSLTVAVSGEGKMRVAWNKGGRRSSLWVLRDHREHVSSGSRVHNFPVVGSDQDGTQVGLYLKPTGPSRMGVGESPTLGDLRPLSQESHTSVMSKAPHEALDAQDITSAEVVLVEESPTPSEKVGTVRHQALTTAVSSGT